MCCFWSRHRLQYVLMTVRIAWCENSALNCADLWQKAVWAQINLYLINDRWHTLNSEAGLATYIFCWTHSMVQRHQLYHCCTCAAGVVWLLYYTLRIQSWIKRLWNVHKWMRADTEVWCSTISTELCFCRWVLTLHTNYLGQNEKWKVEIEAINLYLLMLHHISFYALL